MGARGPRPVPTQKLKDRGSWRGKANEKRGEPMPPAVTATDKAEPPRGLDAEGKRCWRRAVELLTKMRVLTDADLSLLERYCVFMSRWMRLRKKIKKLDQVANGAALFDLDHEQQVVKTLGAYHDRLTKIEIEFGLTPAARTRITRIPEEKNDAPTSEAAKLLQGRNLKFKTG